MGRSTWILSGGRYINPAHVVSVRAETDGPVAAGVVGWRIELVTGEELSVRASASDLERRLRGLRVQRDSTPPRVEAAPRTRPRPRGLGRLLSRLPVDRRYRAGLVRGSRRLSGTLGLRG
jgi:hypothetical protein